MVAHRLLDEGRLADAIEQLTKELVVRPDDLMLRTFLFELLGFAGELERAERELEAIERLDRRPEAQTGVHVYRVLLEAERARGQLFREGRAPQFFSDPPPALLLHLEALDLCRAGRHSEARATLDRAAFLERRRNGVAGGVVVDRVRDSDDLLGPVLEVITSTGYYWVPWQDVQLLFVPPPRDLRDLLWAPARLATNDGMLGEVYLPNLYPDSHHHPDQAVRLGRATFWSDAGSGVVRGVGKKMVLAGEEPRTFEEIGEIKFPPGPDGELNSGRATEELC